MSPTASPARYSALERALTPSRLRERARVSKPQIFARGEQYWRQGKATVVAVLTDEIQGQVQGTTLYQTRLRVPDPRAELVVECDCPYNENGKCCKHAVALGLEWLSIRGLWPLPFPPPLEPTEEEDPDLVVVEVRAQAASEALAAAAVDHLALKLPQTWIGRHLHAWDMTQEPNGVGIWARCLAWGNREEIVDELEWWVTAYAVEGSASFSFRGPDC